MTREYYKQADEQGLQAQRELLLQVVMQLV